MRPGSRTNLQTQIFGFLSFYSYHRLPRLSLDALNICDYAEYPPGFVCSYLSGFRTLYAWLVFDTAIFGDFRLQQMWRALTLTVRYSTDI